MRKIIFLAVCFAAILAVSNCKKNEETTSTPASQATVEQKAAPAADMQTEEAAPADESMAEPAAPTQEEATEQQAPEESAPAEPAQAPEEESAGSGS
jgi:hypothetical protein